METVTSIFASAGTATEPGSPLVSNGYVGNDQPTAPNINFYLKVASGVALAIQAKIQAAGFTLDPTNDYQALDADIALRHAIGETIESEIAFTPVYYSAARSTANPSYPLYNPIIPRYDADHDITNAIAPDLVTAYRAEMATINVAGTRVNSWTGTVSGSTITFSTTPTNLALIMLYTNEALANGYIQAESATFSALYTGTAQRCIRVNGVDYAVTSTSTGAYTITVSGTPASGSQTCQAPTYCIAGSTTSVRLPRISGFVGVVTQDYDGEFVAGWRKMDRIQGHYHALNVYSVNSQSASGRITSGTGFVNTQVPVDNTFVVGPTTDGNNGAPRAGKTVEPKSYARYVYTHAGRLLAAVA
jgi:hypothetical protein